MVIRSPRRARRWALAAALLPIAGLVVVGLPPVSAPPLPLTPAQQTLVAQREQARHLADFPLPAAAESPAVLAAGAPTFQTYDARTATPKDPVNVLFTGAAAPWEVDYAFQHWASTSWRPAGGGHQLAAADGGAAADRFQLEPAGDPGYPAPRTHVRLFPLPGAQTETMADAHHDNAGHSCTDDWQGPAARTIQAFEDPSGRPLWFVAGVYRVSGIGRPAATIQCATYDGTVAVIDLRSLPGTASPTVPQTPALAVVNVHLDRPAGLAPAVVNVSADVVNRGRTALHDVRIGLAADAAGTPVQFLPGAAPAPIAILPAGGRHHFRAALRLAADGWARIGVAAIAAGTAPAIVTAPVRAFAPGNLVAAALAYSLLAAVLLIGLPLRRSHDVRVDDVPIGVVAANELARAGD